jgi:hypothetical protein
MFPSLSLRDVNSGKRGKQSEPEFCNSGTALLALLRRGDDASSQNDEHIHDLAGISNHLQLASTIIWQICTLPLDLTRRFNRSIASNQR